MQYASLGHGLAHLVRQCWQPVIHGWQLGHREQRTIEIPTHVFEMGTCINLILRKCKPLVNKQSFVPINVFTRHARKHMVRLCGMSFMVCLEYWNCLISFTFAYSCFRLFVGHRPTTTVEIVSLLICFVGRLCMLL
jgi:hypothetical protein